MRMWEVKLQLKYILQTSVLEAIITWSRGQWSCADKRSLHVCYVHRAPISQSWSVVCFQWLCWLTGVLLPCIIHLSMKDKLSSVNHCPRDLRIKRGIYDFEIVCVCVCVFLRMRKHTSPKCFYYNSVRKICVVKVVGRRYLRSQKKF